MRTSERLDRIAGVLQVQLTEMRRLAIDLPPGGATSEMVLYTEVVVGNHVQAWLHEAAVLRRVND